MTPSARLEARRRLEGRMAMTGGARAASSRLSEDDMHHLRATLAARTLQCCLSALALSSLFFKLLL